MKKRVRFSDKVDSIADRLDGTKVPNKYKKEYGGRYSRDEAEESARRIAGAKIRDEKAKLKRKRFEEGGMSDDYSNYEIVLITKELQKDGGNISKVRILVSAQNEEEAKNIAVEMWEKDMWNSDLHIVNVMTDSAYREATQQFRDTKWESTNGYMEDGGQIGAMGGEVKWQDVYRGDSALVIADNKLGLIIKPYGRKFHLRFPDGTEKTYDASELKFFKFDDEYANGGMMADGGFLNKLPTEYNSFNYVMSQNFPLNNGNITYIIYGMSNDSSITRKIYLYMNESEDFEGMSVGQSSRDNLEKQIKLNNAKIYFETNYADENEYDFMEN
jgi:hypothetical protein